MCVLRSRKIIIEHITLISELQEISSPSFNIFWLSVKRRAQTLPVKSEIYDI